MAATNLTPVDTSERWGHLPETMREEIDVFETNLRRFQAGETPEKVFTEFRLRHGAYGHASIIPISIKTNIRWQCYVSFCENKVGFLAE